MGIRFGGISVFDRNTVHGMDAMIVVYIEKGRGKYIMCIKCCCVWTFLLIRISLRCDLLVQMNYPSSLKRCLLFPFDSNGSPSSNRRAKILKKKNVRGVITIHSHNEIFFKWNFTLGILFLFVSVELNRHKKNECVHKSQSIENFSPENVEMTIYQVIYTGSTIFMLVN